MARSNLTHRVSALEAAAPQPIPKPATKTPDPDFDSLMAHMEATARKMQSACCSVRCNPHTCPRTTFFKAIETAACSTGDLCSLFFTDTPEDLQFSEVEEIFVWMLLAYVYHDPNDWRDFISKYPSRIWHMSWELIWKPARWAKQELKKGDASA